MSFRNRVCSGLSFAIAAVANAFSMGAVARKETCSIPDADPVVKEKIVRKESFREIALEKKIAPICILVPQPMERYYGQISFLADSRKGSGRKIPIGNTSDHPYAKYFR